MSTDHGSRNRRLELVGGFATGHRAQRTPNTEGALASTTVRGVSGLARVTWSRHANRGTGDVVDRFIHESHRTVSHQNLHATGVAAAGGEPTAVGCLQIGPTGVVCGHARTAVRRGRNRHGAVVRVPTCPTLAHHWICRSGRETRRLRVLTIRDAGLANVWSSGGGLILSSSEDVTDVTGITQIAFGHGDRVARPIQNVPDSEGSADCEWTTILHLKSWIHTRSQKVQVARKRRATRWRCLLARPNQHGCCGGGIRGRLNVGSITNVEAIAPLDRCDRRLGRRGTFEDFDRTRGMPTIRSPSLPRRNRCGLRSTRITTLINRAGNSVGNDGIPQRTLLEVRQQHGNAAHRPQIRTSGVHVRSARHRAEELVLVVVIVQSQPKLLEVVLAL